MKSAEFVKTYLGQLSSRYTLKESLLNVDILVKDIIRRKALSKDGDLITPKELEGIFSKYSSEDFDKFSREKIRKEG